jgi:hypothetical protein
MLEAIYAWRRNGGMRWPRYERSDAIMDLRAASRTSNWFKHGPLLILPLSWIVDSHRALSSTTANTPCPSCRVMNPSLSAREIDQEAIVLVLQTSEHALSISLSSRALTGTPLAASQRRPTGFCLQHGLWHSHRAWSDTRLSVVLNVNKRAIVRIISPLSVYLPSAFRRTQTPRPRCDRFRRI